MTRRNLRHFHSLVVVGKIDTRYLLPSIPRKKKLTSWRGSAPLQHGHARGREARLNFYMLWPLMPRVEVIIEWVAASQFIRELAKVLECANAFSCFFARGMGNIDSVDLMSSFPAMSRNVLRKASVRIDAVACLLSQTFLRSADFHQLLIFIFIDGSLRWHGVGTCAATVDIIIGAFHRRLLLPLITLDKHNTDALDKTIGFL